MNLPSSVSDSGWQVVPVCSTHDLSAFSCGESVLNIWLEKHAVSAAKSGSAQTFVAQGSEGRIIGYYAIAAQSVLPRSAPVRLKKGMPRHPIPVILIARLAVDQNFKGQGVGAGLLKNGLLRSLNAASDLGVRAVIVDAKDSNARRFYEHFNFEPFSSEPNRLFLLIKDLRQLLG